MTIFLRQELDRMQRVIGRVRSTLTDLKLAIDGEFKKLSLTVQKVLLCFEGGIKWKMLNVLHLYAYYTSVLITRLPLL